MKKGIALVLILMCCAWVALPALAEAPAFDHTQLENKDGFSYDDSDRPWSYMGLYANDTGSLILALQLNGLNDELFNPPILLVQSEGMGTPDSLDFLIGETVTTIDPEMVTEDAAIFFLGSSEADFVRALSNADGFSVHVVSENKEVTFDIGQEQYAASSLKECLESVVQYQLWDETNWSDGALESYNRYKPVITVH